MVGWLTGWPVTREALVVHSPGERDCRWPTSTIMSPMCGEWQRGTGRLGRRDPIETAIAELRRRGATAATTVAAIGPFAHDAF